MDIIEAIHKRRSIRSFKPEPVPRRVLEDLMLSCRWSPSGSNTQPWEFAILGGEVLDKVKDRIMEYMKTPAHPDIPYPPMPETFSSRRRALLKLMNSYTDSKGSVVSGKDKSAQRTVGGRFFGASNAIIVYTDREICPRSFLGLGMIAQTIALAALHYGLGTCLMSMVTYWPEVYRELLDIPDSKLIAFGIAIGYPDMDAGINTFSRTREPLETFVKWYGV
jgi:nitroreductase